MKYVPNEVLGSGYGCYIFEAIGLLIGMEDVSMKKKSNYLSFVLTHVCLLVEALLANDKVQNPKESLAKVTNIKRRIMAINDLGKGFNEPLVTASCPKNFLLLKHSSFEAQLELIAILIVPYKTSFDRWVTEKKANNMNLHNYCMLIMNKYEEFILVYWSIVKTNVNHEDFSLHITSEMLQQKELLKDIDKELMTTLSSYLELLHTRISLLIYSKRVSLKPRKLTRNFVELSDNMKETIWGSQID